MSDIDPMYVRNGLDHDSCDVGTLCLSNKINPTGPVIRGGSWGSNASYAAVASRYYFDPSDYDSSIGFRLVRTF